MNFKTPFLDSIVVQIWAKRRKMFSIMDINMDIMSRLMSPALNQLLA